MQPLTRLLFDVSLRGLGILNHRDYRESGEAYFLERLGEVSREEGIDFPGRPVVLDVGANLGSYTELVLAHLPSADIHAFEPHPRTVRRLRDRIGRTVTVLDVAVGASPGTLELFDYVDAEGSSHASAYRDVFTVVHGMDAVAPPVPVPMVRLDDYIEENGLPRVLLLKIDTEGHELEVLKGARSSLEGGRIECVQFEFNEMNVISRVFLRDFVEILSDFSLFRLLPRGMVHLHGAPLEELFAFQNVVAVRRGSPLLPTY